MAKDVTVIDVNISKKYGPAAREAIAQDIIDFIVKRTVTESVDKNGNPLPKYSKGYTKSLDFKNAGKTEKVDLTLSGDMLGTMDLVRHSSGLLRIGYGRGHDERGKAEGNILGTYGKSSPIKGKQRDFLGINKSEIDNIVSNYPLDDKEKLNEQIEETKSTISFADLLVKAISVKTGSENGK